MSANVDHEKYDVRIIRPQLHQDDFKIRGRDWPTSRRRQVIKALHTFNNLETMAVNSYRFAITKEDSELNRQLIAAMANEMTHYQDFTILLYEMGSSPSPLRAFWWWVGFCFAMTGRIFGKRQVLRIGVFVETKAVAHYAELLETVEWDDEMRRIIEKFQVDEDGHINRWTGLLETGKY